jgi:hypothetical protein
MPNLNPDLLDTWSLIESARRGQAAALFTKTSIATADSHKHKPDSGRARNWPHLLRLVMHGNVGQAHRTSLVCLVYRFVLFI